jgi:hypothetical protein
MWIKIADSDVEGLISELQRADGEGGDTVGFQDSINSQKLNQNPFALIKKILAGKRDKKFTASEFRDAALIMAICRTRIAAMPKPKRYRKPRIKPQPVGPEDALLFALFESELRRAAATPDPLIGLTGRPKK